MRHFLLVLAITVIAFGDSLLRISLTNAEPFAVNLIDAIGYTYVMVLGGFDTGTFGN
jgi:ribose/xylose/arabinose/galactoside ABC-type transport system permease subunit